MSLRRRRSIASRQGCYQLKYLSRMESLILLRRALTSSGQLESTAQPNSYLLAWMITFGIALHLLFKQQLELLTRALPHLNRVSLADRFDLETNSLLLQSQMHSAYPPSVLFHLEENQRLRLQLFRLSKLLQQQQHLADSTNRNLQMHLDTIVTQLTLFIKSANKEQASHRQAGAINVINNCLIDLQSIAFSLEPPKFIRSIKLPQEQLMSEWTNKLAEAEATIHFLETQNQRLKIQVTKLNNQQKQFEINSSSLHQKFQVQQREILQLKDKLKKSLEDGQRLTAENNQLRMNMREAQEVSAKHIKYIRNNAKTIELENEKLSARQRETAIREGELMNIIEDKQKQINYMKATIEGYANELASYKSQLSRIIEQDHRIKILEAQKIHSFHLKTDQDNHYTHFSTDHQRIHGKENIKPAAYNEENKRFNLQDFNRKLSLTQQTSS